VQDGKILPRKVDLIEKKLNLEWSDNW